MIQTAQKAEKNRFFRATKNIFKQKKRKIGKIYSNSFVVEIWKIEKNHCYIATPFSHTNFVNRRVLHSLKGRVYSEMSKRYALSSKSGLLYIFYKTTKTKEKIDMKRKIELQKELITLFDRAIKHDTMPSDTKRI